MYSKENNFLYLFFIVIVYLLIWREQYQSSITFRIKGYYRFEN